MFEYSGTTADYLEKIHGLLRSSRIEFVRGLSHAREFMLDGVVYTIIKEEVGKMGQVVRKIPHDP